MELGGHLNSHCKTEGCKHKRGISSSKSRYGISWEMFGICPCCAKEVFPYGYSPENGRDTRFDQIGHKCLAQIREELEQLVNF